MTLKGFITTTMAGLLSLAVLAPAPARADHDDVAKIIAGTAALVIIGAAIAEAMDDNDDYYVTRHGYYRHQPGWGHRSNRYLRHKRHHRHDWHNDRHHRRWGKHHGRRRND